MIIANNKITKRKIGKITYVIKEEFPEEWNKLTEEEKKIKFNEQFARYIIKMEKIKLVI